MVEWIIEQLSYPFVRKGLLAGIFLAAAFAPLSPFVIQRRLSLAGDALAHGTLPGVFIAFSLFGLGSFTLAIGGYIATLLIVAIAAALSWRSIIKSDALLGATYIIFFSIGGVMVSSGSTSLNLQEFLIGTPLGIRDEMLLLTGAMALVSVVTMFIIYRPLALQTQDPAFFASLYRNGWWVTQGFMVLFVLVLITSVNAFGTLLSISFAILPALAARSWANSMVSIMFASFIFGVLACVGGMVLTLHIEYAPTGPTMVLFAGAIWLVSYLLGPFGLRFSLNSSS